MYSKTVTQKHVAITLESQAGNKADHWHQWLKHLNKHQLKEIFSQDLVKRVSVLKYHSVKSVQKERCFKKPFKSVGEIHLTRKLQCVDSDVC